MSRYSNTAYKDKQAKKTKKNKITVDACANYIGDITLHQKITPITPEFIRLVMCKKELYSPSQYHKISKEVKDILGRDELQRFTVIRMLRVDKSKVSEWWSCIIATEYIYEWFASLDQERFVNYINSKERYKKMYEEKGLDRELLFLIFRNRFFKWIDRDGETKKSTHKCMIAINTMRKKIHNTINKQMIGNSDLQKILDMQKSEKEAYELNNFHKDFGSKHYDEKFTEFVDQEYEKLMEKGVFKFPSSDELKEIFDKTYEGEPQEDIDFRNFLIKEKQELMGKGVFKFPSDKEFKEIFDKNKNNKIGDLSSSLVPTFLKKISKHLINCKERVLNANSSIKRKGFKAFLGKYLWKIYSFSSISEDKVSEYKKSSRFELAKLKKNVKAIQVLEIWCINKKLEVKERRLYKTKNGRELWILRHCSSKNIDTSKKAKRYIFKMLALIFRRDRKEFCELLEYLGVKRIKTIKNRISRDYKQSVSKEDWYKVLMKVYQHLIYIEIYI